MEVHSIDEGIKVTINLLSDIRIPTRHVRDVGFPILTAIDNLNTMLNVLETARQQEAEQKEVNDDGVQ